MAVDVMDAVCCYVGPLGAMCDAPAQWVIVTLEDPYDLLETCSAHVGDLLIGGRLNYIWPLIRDEDLQWRCRACGKQTRMHDVDRWEPDGSCLCVACTGVAE
jgi:hypothetical protein